MEVSMKKKKYESTNNEQRFSGLGEFYAQNRPSYPQTFMDYLFSSVGMKEGSVIADIGSGTGILTQQLLDMGCGEVFAVEPNADMRNVAENNLKGYLPKFKSIAASAENTGLSSHSVDYVTVAQAFHWFDRELFKKECKRILKANGKVVLVWNFRDDSTEVILKYDMIHRQHCPTYVENASGLKAKGYEQNLADFFTGEFEMKEFRNDLTFDKQSFIGRSRSSSYALKETDKGYEEYIAALIKLFDEYSQKGLLILPNRARSFAGIV